jgi:hypothetical protein
MKTATIKNVITAIAGFTLKMKTMGRPVEGGGWGGNG